MKNLLLILAFLFCANVFAIDFETDYLKIQIDNKGQIVSFIDKKENKNYVFDKEKSFLLQVRSNGIYLKPQIISYSNQILTIVFDKDIRCVVKVQSNKKYLRFELQKIQSKEAVDLIVWGPYSNTINKIIGETVGVVRGETFALGIQSLNEKTLGGYPWNENDAMPEIDIMEQKDYNDVSEANKRNVLYRVEAAKPIDGGSALQAYCRNRDKERIIENWGTPKYVAEAYNDGGVIGSKIAFFGCPVENTLDCISDIEIKENLPHPMIDGKWGKVSETANASYLIMDFDRNNILEALKYTKEAGLRYLYHSGLHKTWGKFEIDEKKFPKQIEDLRECSELAKKERVMLGTHTLSNFITTNDPYVTPIPDKRLAKVGSSIIKTDLSLEDTEIEIQSPDFFNCYSNNNLKTVQIGNELIRYSKVSEQAPWKLLDCQRGSFGTIKTKHRKDDKIERLADHAYMVFLSNIDLTKEIGKNIADFYNKSGFKQLSFDGIEGCRSTAMGNYGEILLAKTWYDNLSEDIKNHFIVDASRTSHYFWHIYTRMNWGEPWYADFRESQTEYRFKNQEYFKRNLMPGMLGWFLMKKNTSLEDIEWLLTKAAAYDAGFAFFTSFEAIKKNGLSSQIHEKIKNWEILRLNKLFTQEQKKSMLKNEYSLEKLTDNSFNLFQYNISRMEHKNIQKQPGEPVFTEMNFENCFEKQNISFVLSYKGSGSIDKIEIEFDNFNKIEINENIMDGQYLKSRGDELLEIYDANWVLIKSIKIKNVLLDKGKHSAKFKCVFNDADEKSLVKIEFKTKSKGELIKKSKA